MSFRVNRNLGPHTTGPQSIFALLQWLTSTHGGTKFWTVTRSGDGTTGGAGNYITHSGSGAGGLDNSNAWFVLRDPDGNREILFQRTSSGHTYWNLFYSKGCLFTGGTGSSRATATDEKSWMQNRQAGPIALFTGSSWYCHICCEGDTAEGNAYPFWMICRQTGGGAGAAAAAVLMDCVVDALSPSGDADKVILMGTSSALGHVTGAYLSYPSYSHLNSYMRYGHSGSGEEWGEMLMPFLTDGANKYPGSVGTNPEDSKYPILPQFVWRMSGTAGLKGQTHLLRYKPHTAMAIGDVAYDGTDYYLVADDVLLRGWPDSTLPSV